MVKFLKFILGVFFICLFFSLLAEILDFHWYLSLVSSGMSNCQICVHCKKNLSCSWCFSYSFYMEALWFCLYVWMMTFWVLVLHVYVWGKTPFPQWGQWILIYLSRMNCCVWCFSGILVAQNTTQQRKQERCCFLAAFCSWYLSCRFFLNWFVVLSHCSAAVKNPASF